MRLEQQVCSLDPAQRLKELGVQQESLFYWSDTGSGQHVFYHTDFDGRSHAATTALSAFTATELGEMLPPITVYTQHRDGWLIQCKTERSINATGQHGRARQHHTMTADTEADARANMLIYLLEHDLIAPPR